MCYLQVIWNLTGSWSVGEPKRSCTSTVLNDALQRYAIRKFYAHVLAITPNNLALIYVVDIRYEQFETSGNDVNVWHLQFRT